MIFDMSKSTSASPAPSSEIPLSFVALPLVLLPSIVRTVGVDNGNDEGRARSREEEEEEARGGKILRREDAKQERAE